MELVTLVLDIPGYVEDFVDLARTVKKFKSLEQDHKRTVEESIFFANLLKVYAGYVNATDPKIQNHKSRPLLEEALRNAYGALHIAEGILEYWSRRLNEEVEPKEKTARTFKSITKAVTDKLGCVKSPAHDSTEGPDKKSGLQLLPKASYLAFGSVEIREAMERLDKWTTRLSQLLLTLPNLQTQESGPHATGGLADDVAFVTCARERVKSNNDVLVIDHSHLESMFDIDPLHTSTIYRIADGDYAGHIVDVRKLNLRRDSILEEEARGTEHICRLFADTPADREYRARASVGILPCVGYAVAERSPTHFLLFRPPLGTGTPRTLRNLLLSGPAQHSLDARLGFCVKLATSALIIQSLGLVHKNIRPDSIIVTSPLSSDSSAESLGTPYLLSLGQARDAAGPTGKRPYIGEALAKTLYIHPRHLAARKRKKYQMRDDIYSLGICLLEVAIWKSLLKWSTEKGGFVCDFDVCEISDECYEEVLKKEGIPIDHDKCWMRRDGLVKFAEKSVPPAMGNTFKEVVKGCLQFGEQELSYRQTLEKIIEENSHDEEADSQSVMFVQDILSKLRGLVFSTETKSQSYRI